MLLTQRVQNTLISLKNQIVRVSKTANFLDKFKSSYLGGVQGGKIPYIPYGVSEDYYDAYPQYLIDLINGSGTLFSCVDADSKVIRGQGFKIEAFEKLVINSKGHTIKYLLEQTTNDFSAFRGWAWKIDYNAFFKVCEVTHIPFEKCRQGVPNHLDKIEAIAVTSQYDNLMYGIYPSDYYRAKFFDVYNPDAKFLNQAIDKYKGLPNYPGQIFYFFKDRWGSRYYPKPIYHSVLKDCESERDISESKNYDIQDRFKSTVVVTEYGASQLSEQEKGAKTQEYQQFSGSNGARIKLNFAENRESKPDIDVVDTPDLAKNYLYAENSTQNNIRRIFKYPDIIYGIATAGKLGQQTEIDNAVRYANEIAKSDRETIEQEFARVFSNFYGIEKVNPTLDFQIKDFQLLKEVQTDKNTELIDNQPLAKNSLQKVVDKSVNLNVG